MYSMLLNPDSPMNLKRVASEDVMSELMNYDRRPEDISKEFAATVAATIEISGKSTRTILRPI